MSTSLTQQVAEALYSAGPVILSWDEIKDSPHGQRLIDQAEAVIPLILDAAKDAINEAVDERGFTESTDYDNFLAIDVVGVMDAIDSLRTKP